MTSPITYSPRAIARKELAAQRALVRMPAPRRFPWLALAFAAALALGALAGVAF